MRYTKEQQIDYQKNKIKYHYKRLTDLGLTKDEILKLLSNK